MDEGPKAKFFSSAFSLKDSFPYLGRNTFGYIQYKIQHCMFVLQNLTVKQIDFTTNYKAGKWAYFYLFISMLLLISNSVA